MKAQRYGSWLKKRCPECGCEFEYPEGGYEPSTCGNYECIRKHLHPFLKTSRSRP